MKIELPTLHPGQQKVVDEAKRFNVPRCARRFGKTTLAINRLLLHNNRGALHGYPVGFFAPSSKYFSNVWLEMVEIVRPITQRVNVTERQIRLYGGGIIDFWSLDKAGPGEGRKYAVVVFDEAQLAPRLEEQWLQSIRPTLTDFEGHAWIFYKPKGSLSYVNKLYAQGVSTNPDYADWNAWSLKTEDNPTILRSEIAAARRDMPPDVFRQEYEAVPAADGGNPFGLEAIEDCVGALSDRDPVAWGWDLAKSSDFTVGIGLDANGYVSRFHRFQMDWEDTEQFILANTRAPALVDSTGVGDPIVERLRRRSGLFTGYKFSATSKQQLMVGLRTAIHTREIHYPRGVIKDELDSFQFEYTMSGGISYSAPGSLHDDCVMALALAQHQLRNAAYLRDPVATAVMPNEDKMAALVEEQRKREEQFLAEERARMGLRDVDLDEDARWRRIA